MNNFPLSYPKASLVPILHNTPLVSYSDIKTPPNSYTHARIHSYPLQPGHISLRGTKMNIKLFLKCRPTGQIRGSSFRVKLNGLAGQVDPTRMKPVSHGSIGRWWVGSGQDVLKSCGSGRVKRFSNFTGRVGSDREAFKISRFGSGQVNIPQNFRGSGRVS